MVDAVRVTQTYAEAIVNVIPDDKVRVTQSYVEAIVNVDTVDRVRVSQNFIEVLAESTGSEPPSTNPIRSETVNVILGF